MKKKMQVYVYVTEDDHQTDFSQNIFWHEHETERETVIVLQWIIFYSYQDV